MLLGNLCVPDLVFDVFLVLPSLLSITPPHRTFVLAHKA
jgi:hypothetical protein